jgi:hypothetical protein
LSLVPVRFPSPTQRYDPANEAEFRRQLAVSFQQIGHSLEATSGGIGGWFVGQEEITSPEGGVKIQASAERILLGAATAPLTGVGVFIGLDGSDYEFRVGDPSGDYIHWDGSSFVIEAESFTADNPVFSGSLEVLAFKPSGSFFVVSEGDGNLVQLGRYLDQPELPSNESWVRVEHSAYGVTGFWSRANVIQLGGGGNDSGEVELIRFDLSDEANPVLVFPEKAVADTDAAWSVSSTSERDALFARQLAGGTPGDGAFGPSIGFSKINGAGRRAAIVARQSGGDDDRVGLSIFAHPSTTGATDLEEVAQFGAIGGDNVNTRLLGGLTVVGTITAGSIAGVPTILAEEISWDVPSTDSDDVTSDTFTVTGAETGDAVVIALRGNTTNAGAAFTFYGYVSSADTVTILARNLTAGTVNPGSIPFTILVFK